MVRAILARYTGWDKEKFAQAGILAACFGGAGRKSRTSEGPGFV